MNIIVQNPEDNEFSVTIQTRNSLTGGDGPALSIEPGQSAEVEITPNDHLVAIAGEGHTSNSDLVAAPRLLGAGDEGRSDTELNDGTDDEIRGIVQARGDLPKTAGGSYKLSNVNAALAQSGFKPIDAAKRDELFPAA